jgi:hypothetical protein
MSPNVIGPTTEELLPVPRFPKPEPLHFFIVIPHRGIPVRCTMEVEVNQLLQVSSDDLVGIDKDDFVEVHGKQDVEKEDLICPDNALLFSLLPQPCWPFIGDEFILEAIFLSELGYKFLRRMFSGAPTNKE